MHAAQVAWCSVTVPRPEPCRCSTTRTFGPDLLSAVADASPPKQGRRFPGVGVPIIAPEEILARRPDEVVLFVPDMLDEIRQRFPEIERGGGRWVVLEPAPRVVDPLRSPPSASADPRLMAPAGKGIAR